MRKIFRLLITILDLLIATHLMYLNDTLNLLRLAPISAVEAEGTLPKIFFLGSLQGILKNACQIPIKYHRKQQKIMRPRPHRLYQNPAYTGLQLTQALISGQPTAFAFTLHINVPLEEKRYISLLLKE